MSPICTSFWNQKVTTVPGPPRGSICQLSYSEKAPLELFGNNSTQYFVLFVETHFVSVSEKSFSYNCLLFLHKLSKSFEILCLNWPQWPKMTTRGSSGPATHRIFSTFSFMSKYWKTKLWGLWPALVFENLLRKRNGFECVIKLTAGGGLHPPLLHPPPPSLHPCDCSLTSVQPEFNYSSDSGAASPTSPLFSRGPSL